MTEVTAGEIAEFVNGVYSGDRAIRVAGIAPLAGAGESQLSFLANPRYAGELQSTRAAAILVRRDLRGDSPRWIRVEDPYFAMARVAQRWFAVAPELSGISPLAFIAQSARLGNGAALGPFVTIGDDVVIGDEVKIFSGVSIGPRSSIGDGTVVHANVTIYHDVAIGRRCIVHGGVVIGSDGYGFATSEGRHHKVPQMGRVRVEDDVEIGAGTTIDRATLGETVIGEGTKIDNLVQVGHGAKIGKHCLLVAQVAIAGSAELGDHVVVAGQSGIAGHLKIGRGVQVAAKSAVFKDVADGMKVMGAPAISFREFARREAMLRRMMKRRVR